MRNRVRRSFFVAVALSLVVALSPFAQAQKKSARPARAAAPSKNSFNVPVTYYKLPNGLKVVLSQDTSSPTVAIAVYYQIGFRIEPKERTGFAHLFEHMMFKGSENVGSREHNFLIANNGGTMNGTTN
ncbi:MAG TPA: insulinase family protein, partial [Pyrinomonadaceae bacterium]|nr:insulinase family protein [Pyrinomonadaceae bacterium]